MRHVNGLLKDESGSALVEFAIVLPLLVVFTVGIFDFSAGFNQKQKIAQAAQQGAIIAGAQPTSDMQTDQGNPTSLQPVVTAIFNSLASSGVLTNANQAPCSLPDPPAGWVPAAPVGLSWTYTISHCSAANPDDDLTITINRGLVVGGAAAGTPATVCTMVTVTYPYHWKFFSNAIQLLFPLQKNYSAPAQVIERATVYNQT